jgi:hypothetical protein
MSRELHALGINIFKLYSDVITANSPAAVSAQRHLATEEQRFRLWAHSLGLHQKGHSSLDYRVRDAATVRTRLAEILRHLESHLEEILAIWRGERRPFEEDDSVLGDENEDDIDEDTSSRGSAPGSPGSAPSRASSESSPNEVEFRIRSVEEALDALYSLATKIRNPRNRPQRAVLELYKHVPAAIRAIYIQEREQAEASIVAYVQRQQLLEAFRQVDAELTGQSVEGLLQQYAPLAHWLIRRTGVANARRRQQLVYWKEHAERIMHSSIEEAPPAPLFVPQETMQSALTSQESISRIEARQDHGPEKSLATSATKLGDNFVKLDDLRSVISHESKVSTALNLKGERLEWPSPPHLTTSSKFFTCPYCMTICPQRYLSQDAWR